MLPWPIDYAPVKGERILLVGDYDIDGAFQPLASRQVGCCCHWHERVKQFLTVIVPE